MKNRKVLNLRTHVGGLLAKTSIDSYTHKSDMELWPIGILVKTMDGKPFLNPKSKEPYEVFVPFANVVEVQVSPDQVIEDTVKHGDSETPPSPVTSLTRRGRPPKDPA